MFYRLSKFKRAAFSKEFASKAYENLHKTIDRYIPERDSSRSKADECLQKKDVIGLIKLYTIETGFHVYL